MKTNASWIVTGSLILALIVLPLKAAESSSNTSTDSQGHQPNTVLCVALLVVVGVVLYAVYRCAQTAGLTNPPAPPPNTNTNSASGHFVLTFKPMDLTPPGPTNGVPGTNDVGPLLVPGTAIVNFNTVLATNNDANMEVIQDISTNGWTDWQGNPYTWYLVTQTDPTGPHVQSSTNLVDWTNENYTVSMWLSSTVTPDPGMSYFTNAVTVLYDGNGSPVVTNWSSIPPTGTLNVGIPASSPLKFYRGVTP